MSEMTPIKRSQEREERGKESHAVEQGHGAFGCSEQGNVAQGLPTHW